MENQNKAEIVDGQEKPSGNGQINNYVQYIVQTIKHPEDILSDKFQAKHQFGLITMISFLALILISNLLGLVSQKELLEYFGFKDYFSYFNSTISYALALILLLFVFKNQAAKTGTPYEINFFLEKLGALLVIPSILLLLSIPLELLDVTIHYWLSSLARTLLYVGVFMTSYLYISRNDIRTATIHLAGFYIFYSLVSYVL
ncbi:hypothetical protein [Ornithinibacillus scapharcae]|uniref:hypothetical protein n=1 Tax=Ornithinibacillus scapharcae TaxID=1147159 RepID=UPI000225BF4C|nr:hypothetical protein [Ornithinibacillus scapharcae]